MPNISGSVGNAMPTLIWPSSNPGIWYLIDNGVQRTTNSISLSNENSDQ